jgi:hypothetical protein
LCLRGGQPTGRSGILYDIEDEIEAYTRQVAFEPYTFGQSGNGEYAKITNQEVRTFGVLISADYHNLPDVQLSINSTVAELRTAYAPYPNSNSTQYVQALPLGIDSMQYKQMVSTFANYWHYNKNTDIMEKPHV